MDKLFIIGSSEIAAIHLEETSESTLFNAQLAGEVIRYLIILRSYIFIHQYEFFKFDRSW